MGNFVYLGEIRKIEGMNPSLNVNGVLNSRYIPHQTICVLKKTNEEIGLDLQDGA